MQEGIKKTININFFAGPCVGKSATGSGVFNMLKIRGHNAEMTQEYAKELVYSEDWVRLSDQLSVAGEQHHRMFRLQNKVEYAVHDSPFVMGLKYSCNSRIPTLEFSNLLVEQFKRYENFNVFLVRNHELEYKQEGRIQDLAGAIELDKEIKHMLDVYGIKYVEVPINEFTTETICDLVEAYND